MTTSAQTTFKAPAGEVSTWSPAEKLGEAMSRSLPHLAPQARGQIERMLTRDALAFMVGVLAVWFGAHVIGMGFAADAVLLVAGLVAIGTAVFEGLDHLYQFAAKALLAKTTADLDHASRHFAKAVSILGVEAVLAVLFRGKPKTYHARRIEGIQSVRRPTGRLTLSGTRNPVYLDQPRGTDPKMMISLGSTYPNGQVYIYRPPPGLYSPALIEGHRVQRRLAAYHEAVHRALTPKLNVLYRFRVERKRMSYNDSSLYRYLEEALAETIAQVRIHGFREVVSGVTFPVKNGYITLLLRDARRFEKGAPVLIETGGFLAGNLLVHGMLFDVHHSHHLPHVREVVP